MAAIVRWLSVFGWLGFTGVAAAQLPAPSRPSALNAGPSFANLLAPEAQVRPAAEPAAVLTGEPAEGTGEGERDEIETDRDSFTPASTTVASRRWIVESAYTYSDNRGFADVHSFPEFLLRYGLTDRVELRLGYNYETGGVAETGDALGSEDRVVNEHNISYGVKLLAIRPDGLVPRTALILMGFTPAGGSEGANTATQFVATAVAGWDFPNRWRFDVAFRYGFESEEGDRHNVWAPSVVLKVPVGEKWAAHAEYFGLFTTGKEQNTNKQFFSPGVHYLVNPDLELGVRTGWGLNDETVRFFVNAGFGWRY